METAPEHKPASFFYSYKFNKLAAAFDSTLPNKRNRIRDKIRHQNT
jgi:hypothetical protein